jgi:cytochrome P450
MLPSRLMSNASPIRQIADLPGPRGWPLVGNALQIEASRIHLIFEDWCRQYGPLFRVRLGRKDMVVVADTSLIAQVLRERPEHYRRGTLVSKAIDEMGVTNVFPAEGEDWKRQRLIWNRAMGAQKLKTFHQELHDVTGRLLRRWRAAAAAGTVIDVQKDLMLYTVDVTMRFALGYDANTLEQPAGAIQRHLDKVFPALGRRISSPIPYWRLFKLPQDYALERALKGAYDEVSMLVERARARMAANPELREHPSCLLEALLVAQEAEGGSLSDRELFGNAVGALLAGEDTTANTLAWMTYFIAQDADIQQRLQAEADAVLGTDELLRDAASFNQLPLVDAVMNESLRLKPVAPFISAESNVEVMLGDLRIPAGTQLFLLTRMGCLEESEYPKPQDFLPDRGWLNATDPQAVRPAMPFGYGPRICPGRTLAISEIRAVTTMLARNFRLSLVEGEEPVTERLAFTMMPVNLRLRLENRG